MCTKHICVCFGETSKDVSGSWLGRRCCRRRDRRSYRRQPQTTHMFELIFYLMRRQCEMSSISYNNLLPRGFFIIRKLNYFVNK